MLKMYILNILDRISMMMRVFIKVYNIFSLVV